MFIKSASHVSILFCVAFASLSCGKSEAQITGLGFFEDGDSSFASDVSGDGTTVVGSARDADGVNRMIRWTANEGLVNLDDGSGGSSSAESVSFDGSVIVGRQSSESGRWTSAAGFTSLGAQISAEAVSGDGNVIVGTRFNGIGTSQPEAFRWTEATGVVGLGNLDVSGTGESTGAGVSYDGSVIVGRTTTDSGGNGPSRGFRWTEADGMMDLGVFSNPLFSSNAHDVSDDGSVVSGHGLVQIFGDFRVEASRWTEDTGMVGLGLSESVGFEISGDGNTVGGFATVTTGGGAASLWTEESGMISVYELLQLQGHDVSEWESLNWVTGISQDGLVISGVGTNASGNQEGWVARLNPSSVPEPGSAAIIALCLSPVVFLRRRKI